MAKSRVGRPALPASKRRVSQSVTLDQPTWKEIDKTASLHGVTRSQIVHDAWNMYKGDMATVLQHLREELDSQEQNRRNMAGHIKSLETENERLQASQAMVGSILSPFAGPDSKLSKEAKERARTLRAVMHNPNNVHQVQMLIEGRLDRPTVPILGDAFQAWGGWLPLMEAIKAAEQAQGEPA